MGGKPQRIEIEKNPEERQGCSAIYDDDSDLYCKLQWLDGVRKDLRKLGVKDW